MLNNNQLANRLFTGRTRRALVALGIAATPIILNGCLMSTPYWNQKFADHTGAIPFQRSRRTNLYRSNSSVPRHFTAALIRTQ